MFNPQEKEAVKKYFGRELEALDLETFRSLLKSLRAKYHPDNFEKFADETVREMATERFQQIESLAQKIEAFLKGHTSGFAQAAGDDYRHAHARFAARKLKIEIITRDKDLKYHLFGTFYRWLVMGDSYKIPDTAASIIIDEHHKGTRIGFQEAIRMYLTFDAEDSIDTIANWLFDRIRDRADSLLIKGENVAVQEGAIHDAIRRITFLGIAAPDA